MKRKSIIILSLLVIIGIAAAVSAVFGMVASPTVSQGTTVPVSTPPPATAIKLPEVTEAEKAKAIEIALRDSRVQELLAGKSYVVAPVGATGPRIGLWHEGKRKFGVTLEIQFDKPYFIDYDWPYVEWRDQTQTSFVRKTRAVARMATGLLILVNLNVETEDDSVAVIVPI